MLIAIPKKAEQIFGFTYGIFKIVRAFFWGVGSLLKLPTGGKLVFILCIKSLHHKRGAHSRSCHTKMPFLQASQLIDICKRQVNLDRFSFFFGFHYGSFRLVSVVVDKRNITDNVQMSSKKCESGRKKLENDADSP